MRKCIFFSVLTILFLNSLHYSYAQSSTNFRLEDYGFSAGDTTDSQSTNFGVRGITGEQTGDSAQSTNFQALPGLIFSEMSNTPLAPTFTNPANYYNKLRLVINTSSDPTDTQYAIAISTDNFTSDIRYVQDNQSVGSSLGNEDWQYLSSWGGVSGFEILSLLPSTSYQVRVASRQGTYTQSPFGPAASASTVSPQMTFDIDIAPLDQESAAPYNLAIGTLSQSSVTTANDRIWFDVSTNAQSGATVYIYSNVSGLLSTSANYTINTATGNLASLNEGFGIRGDTTAQLSGGPLIRVAPYDGSGDTIGSIDTTIRSIFTTSSLPITNARGSLLVKAKATTTTPAAQDYTTTIYLISAGNF